MVLFVDLDTLGVAPATPPSLHGLGDDNGFMMVSSPLVLDYRLSDAIALKSHSTVVPHPQLVTFFVVLS